MSDCSGNVDWVMLFLVGGAGLALGAFALMVYGLVRDHFAPNGRGGNV